MHHARAASLIAVLVLAACGGDDGPPPLVGGAGGTSGDGGTAGTGGMDAGDMDASSALDGGDDDGGTAPAVCVPADDDRYVHDTVSADPSTFNLAAAPAGFGLAYEVSTCGHGIDVVRFPSAIGPFTVDTVVNGTGDCSHAYDPTLHYGNGQWRTVYWDNRGGSNQLWSLVLDGASQPELLVGSADSGRAPQITTLTGEDYVAWVEQSTPPSQWTAFYTRKLADDGATTNPVIAPEAAQHGFGFVFAGVEAVGVVGWVDTQRLDKGIFLQPVTEAGVASGLPVTLATQVSNRSSIDFADGAMNAAVVYSTVTDGVAFEVRFRQLDETGRPIGTEERVVPRVARGTDGSIAPIGNGYVIAYRELPETSDGSAAVKLFIVDKAGRKVTQTLHVADTTVDGGRVTVRSTLDGRFAVAWVEADGTGQRVRAVRVRCR